MNFFKQLLMVVFFTATPRILAPIQKTEGIVDQWFDENNRMYEEEFSQIPRLQARQFSKPDKGREFVDVADTDRDTQFNLVMNKLIDSDQELEYFRSCNDDIELINALINQAIEGIDKTRELLKGINQPEEKRKLNNLKKSFDWHFKHFTERKNRINLELEAKREQKRAELMRRYAEHSLNKEVEVAIYSSEILIKELKKKGN